MVKGAIILGKEIVEVKNVEIYEYCLLNRKTGKKEFLDHSTEKGFKGSYFKDENNFFAIYPTNSGPMIYFDKREYPVSKKLNMSLQKNGKNRKFNILDYKIEINYIESIYLNWDVWSEEEDVDLFYMIEQNYKKDSFYERFILKDY
jgi:hypothetical protein